MTGETKTQRDEVPSPKAGAETPRVNGLTWPVKRAYWAVEKYLLWPIADSFKWAAERLRYRSPFAYIGATLAVTVTLGAVAAAVYFHNESKNSGQTIVTQVPEGATSVTIPTAPLEQTTDPSAGNGDTETLQGVAPSFETSSDSNGKSGGSDATQVKPADPPKSGPLKTAQQFATTFVEYEVGTKGAAKDFKQTATKQLAKALAVDPPRQPSNGTVPKATVLNVVKGPKEDGQLGVSVALMRLGTSSELRLALKKDKDTGGQWLVTEVRG